MSVILGVDPGLSGALAMLWTEATCVRIHDMPTFSLARNGKKKREIDAHSLVELIAAGHPAHAFIEQVGAMPGQGLSSTFSFGKSYGVIIGVLIAHGVPITFVNPRVWKKALGVPAAKDGARARASQLLPAAAHHWQLVKHDGRAEASLIALWGLRSLRAIAAPVLPEVRADAPPQELADMFDAVDA